MPVVFHIGGQAIRCDAETISIGRAPSNQISLPEDTRLAPVQAVLKLVAGRWIIESREGGPIRVGAGRPTQFAWLNSGDVIQLTESGPEITFAPENTGAIVAAVQVSGPAAKPPQPISPRAAGQLAAAGAIESNFTKHPMPALGQVTPAPDRSKTPVPGSIPSWLLYAGGGGTVAALLICVGMLLSNGGTTNSGSAPLPTTPADSIAVNETPSATATPAGDGVPGLAAADARLALFSLEVRTADRSRTVQLGTAWAVASRRLVTTGDAARGIALNREYFPIAFARHMRTGTEYEIAHLTLHPEYDAAVNRADEAIAEIKRLLPELEGIKDAEARREAEEHIRKLDSEAIVATEETINVNIAVLELIADSPASLAWEQSVPLKAGQQMTLMGQPFPRTDALVDPDNPKPLERQVGRIQQVEPVVAQVMPARCLVKFVGVQKDHIWSGSPVLSANGAVIGVYVRPTPPPRGTGTAPAALHDIAVMNGLRDWLPKMIAATGSKK